MGNIGDGYLEVRATALSGNSAVARLVQLVEQAQMQTSPTEQRVKTVARYYTPIVVLMALCMATIPFAWGKETGLKWVKTALVMLVIGCPCALVISTPITYVSGLAH